MKQFRADNKEELNKYHREYYRKNKSVLKAKTKNNYLKRKYGIDSVEYKTLFDKQKGCCAICGTTQCDRGGMLSVDHNHTTGKVRGLLCAKCNLLIADAKETILTLNKAIDYLKEHGDGTV